MKNRLDLLRYIHWIQVFWIFSQVYWSWFKDVLFYWKMRQKYYNYNYYINIIIRKATYYLILCWEVRLWYILKQIPFLCVKHLFGRFILWMKQINELWHCVPLSDVMLMEFCYEKRRDQQKNKCILNDSFNVLKWFFKSQDFN